MRNNYQYKVAILFYMLIVMQVQPEFKHDHNHDHHHKHSHDHDHDHHGRSEIRKASRIYNGVRTPPGQAKFMAVMTLSRTRNLCSAVIITENMLLTAAHCLYNQSYDFRTRIWIFPRAFQIQTFRDNPFGDHPLMRRIMNFWIHPRYETSPHKIYDIAIIQIGPQPWRLGHEVDTALMPVRIRHLDLRVIKGYGFGREVGEISPAYLNEVDFKYYWNQTYCEMIRRLQRSNDPDVFFGVTNFSPDNSRNPNIFRNLAPGDSGGGIFMRGSVERLDRSHNKRTIPKIGLVLVGISSHASNYSKATGNLNRPYGTYAVNVTTMMPWINSIVGVDFVTYPFPLRPE